MQNSVIFFIIVGGISLFLAILIGRVEAPGRPLLNPLMRKYGRISFFRLCLFILRTVILSLTLLVPLHLTKNTTTLETIPESALIILLDVSQSMQADDISPSRIEKAKEYLTNFLSKAPKMEIGYIIFSGKAFLMSPLSIDSAWLSEIIKQTTTKSINQSKKDASGTNIGDALLLAINTLRKSEKKGEILLITDGRANVGIKPMLVANEAQKIWIKIHTIAIGSLSGWVLSYIDDAGKRQYFYDENGNKLTADVDTALLQDISDKTLWSYYSVKDGKDLREIFENIITHFSKETEKVTKSQETDLSPLFLTLLVLIVLLYAWWSWVWRNQVSKIK